MRIAAIILSFLSLTFALVISAKVREAFPANMQSVDVLATENAAAITVSTGILSVTIMKKPVVEAGYAPPAARLQYDMEDVAKEIKKRLASVWKPLSVAVIGFLVSGPGEARGADIALAGGKCEAVLYRKGVEIGKVKESELVDAVVNAVINWQE